MPKNRRTIAFAVQSIQKRVPKAIGPAIGRVFRRVRLANLVVALGFVGWPSSFNDADEPDAAEGRSGAVPIREIMRTMPADLRRLLRAEIFIRWGDWFARDFAG